MNERVTGIQRAPETAERISQMYRLAAGAIIGAVLVLIIVALGAMHRVARIDAAATKEKQLQAITAEAELQLDFLKK